MLTDQTYARVWGETDDGTGTAFQFGKITESDSSTGNEVTKNDLDYFVNGSVLPGMELSTMTVCYETRRVGTYPSTSYRNVHVCGLQFTYGKFDSDGNIEESLPLYAHGKLTDTCQTLLLGPDYYLSRFNVANDHPLFYGDINRLITTRIERNGGADKSFTYAALRPRSDRSTLTDVTFGASDQWKIFGIKGTSTESGFLLGFELLLVDQAAFDSVKAEVIVKQDELTAAQAVTTDAQTAFDTAESDAINAAGAIIYQEEKDKIIAELNQVILNKEASEIQLIAEAFEAPRTVA